MATSKTITTKDIMKAGIDEDYLASKFPTYSSFTPTDASKKAEEFITSLSQDDRKKLLSDKQKEVKSKINAEFDTVAKKLTKRLETNITGINKARDELLKNTMLQSGIDDAVLTTMYGARYTSFVPKDPSKKAEEFISGKDANGKYYISIAEKLDIIAERTNNEQIFMGNGKFSADLGDTQKIKSANKKTYLQSAENIKQYLQEVVNNNQKLITELEGRITDHRKQLAELEAKQIPGPGKQSTMGANGTVMTSERTEADVAREQAQKEADIKKLEADIRAEVEELNRLRDEHNLYVDECQKRVDEINEMLNQGKIFSGLEQTEEKETDKTEENSQVGSLSTTIKNEKDLAKSMLKDFYNRSTEEQNVILEQCGSKDILNAAMKAGRFAKKDLAKILRARIADLPDGSTITIGSTSISKDDLTNGIEADKLRDLQREIADFNEQFKNKTPEEIKEFEKSIKWIRFASYLQETKIFGNIRRFFAGHNSKTYRNFEMSKTLARYAEIKNLREVDKLNRLNEWRKTLKMGQVNDIAVTNPRALDRTGTHDINNQHYQSR